MRVEYVDLSESEFNALIRQESENTTRIRSGRGLSDINVYRRKTRQGEGIFGSIFGKLVPKILPILKNYIFPAAKSLGENVISDVIKGEKFKSSLKKRGLQSAGDMASRIMRRGRGMKRRRKRSVKTSSRKRVKYAYGKH